MQYNSTCSSLDSGLCWDLLRAVTESGHRLPFLGQQHEQPGSLSQAASSQGSPLGLPTFTLLLTLPPLQDSSNPSPFCAAFSLPLPFHLTNYDPALPPYCPMLYPLTPIIILLQISSLGPQGSFRNSCSLDNLKMDTPSWNEFYPWQVRLFSATGV